MRVIVYFIRFIFMIDNADNNISILMVSTIMSIVIIMTLITGN